jgi:hypothetical protein
MAFRGSRHALWDHGRSRRRSHSNAEAALEQHLNSTFTGALHIDSVYYVYRKGRAQMLHFRAFIRTQKSAIHAFCRHDGR